MRRAGGERAPRRLPLLFALAVLLLGIGASVWFSQRLADAEQLALDRYVDHLASFARSDLLSGVAEQVQAQQRIAGRLQRQSYLSEEAWREDARHYQRHYPYYVAMAVLDPALKVQWLEPADPRVLPSGQPLDLDERYQRLLFDTGFVVVPPIELADGRPAVMIIHAIRDDDSISGHLLTLMAVPDAIATMHSQVFRDDLVLRVTVRGQPLYPFPALPMPERYRWSSGHLLDLDGDGEGFLVEFGISEDGQAQHLSALPRVALVGGIAVAVLLAVLTLLGMNARRQAVTLAASNRRLETEVREREQAEQELAFLANHDPLTGLANRTGASRHLESMLLDAEREGGQLALMFLDLDQFKDINDSLGHQLGDRLLCEIPRRLAGVLKENDFVGRHGGDEFLLAVRRSGRDQIEQLAVNILRSMDSGFAIDDTRFFISASIGIAYYPDAGRTVNELIQNADTALFKAKNGGRNQFAVFTREMFAQAQHRLNLSRDIRHALDAGQFRVVYQPIVSLKDASLCGLEALLRWEHEKGYLVPPQEFIRVAEETGVIGRLGQFALERALADLAHWKTLTDQPPWLAVNISGVQVREGSFAERLSVLLHQYRIEPELLHLEITEEVLIENLTRNRRILQKLDDIGMRIVVDDFGVGYSSLAYLKNFPISVVKIDRGFIQDLAVDREDQAITRTICSLAADLGMLTVAEGVENAEQLALLRDFNCSFAQGYLFSRPVEFSAVEAMLRQRPLWARAAGD